MRVDARRGVAVVLALLVLTLAGMFLAAAFYAARSDEIDGRTTLRIAQLDAAGESALAAAIVAWDTAARFAQPVGTTSELSIPSPDARAVTRTIITRLSDYSYLVTVRSRGVADSAVAASGSALLTMAAPRFPAFAAATANGDIAPVGSFSYEFPDSSRSLACGDTSFRTAPPAGFAVPASYGAPAPETHTSAAADDSTYRVFGAVPLAALMARPGIVFAPGASASAPTAALAVARGDLRLEGGAGRGVLIVIGRLVMDGPLEFQGVIVALGGLYMRSGQAAIDGMVLVDGGTPAGIVADPDASMRLRFDSCLIADVAWHAGHIETVPGWGWRATP